MPISELPSVSGESPASDSMAGEESAASSYRVLVDRCLSLEASQSKLKEEFDELAQQDKRKKMR